MKNTIQTSVIALLTLGALPSSAATVTLQTGLATEFVAASSSASNNFVFADGLGNSVTIAVTLTDSSGGNLDAIDGDGGLVSDHARPFMRDNQTLAENAVFTATIVASSANVDASTIEFQINSLGFRALDNFTAGDLDWVSDGHSAPAYQIVLSTGFYSLALDNQFHNLATGDYSGTLRMNTVDNGTIYQMRDNNSSGTTLQSGYGLTMTTQFSLIPEPCSACILGISGVVLILRRRRS